MIGNITTPGVKMNPRITPITPSQSAHATNQKTDCNTPATSVINTPTGRNEFLEGFTVLSFNTLQFERFGRLSSQVSI